MQGVTQITVPRERSSHTLREELKKFKSPRVKRRLRSKSVAPRVSHSFKLECKTQFMMPPPKEKLKPKPKTRTRSLNRVMY